jgi:hypothetical protein
MKRFRIHIFIVMAITFIYACKKDKGVPIDSTPVHITSTSTTTPAITTPSYDTVFPLSYFPVFPASYWKYSDSNGDTMTIRTDSLYQLDYYTVMGAPSDTFFVPVYNNQKVWGYEVHSGPTSFSGSYPFKKILSETLAVGSSWNIYHWSGTSIDRMIMAKDTTINIFGNTYYPTIVVKEYYGAGGPPNYPWIAKRYYTKNIGLVKEEIYNNQNSTVNTKQLITYFINN